MEIFNFSEKEKIRIEKNLSKNIRVNIDELDLHGVLVSVYDCNNLRMARVFRFNSEEEMLLSFRDIINDDKYNTHLLDFICFRVSDEMYELIKTSTYSRNEDKDFIGKYLGFKIE